MFKLSICWFYKSFASTVLFSKYRQSGQASDMKIYLLSSLSLLPMSYNLTETSFSHNNGMEGEVMASWV